MGKLGVVLSTPEFYLVFRVIRLKEMLCPVGEKKKLRLCVATVEMSPGKPKTLISSEQTQDSLLPLQEYAIQTPGLIKVSLQMT